MSPKEINEKITALGIDISVASKGTVDDYISLTDIARYKSDETKMVIQNWMRNRNTIEFLGVWETLNNPNFKGIEFDAFRKEAGLNSFVMTPTKWIASTDAIGIRTKRGRYGSGTFAHVDIAFEFASWISPEFKLYVIKDYQRLKTDENNRLSLEWNEKRLFTKINYRLHTDAIKEHLVPDISETKKNYVYANEADVLNAALFGMTAKEWRAANPDKKGNIRDYASLNQLIVLANLESMNAELIKRGIPQAERAIALNIMAMEQLERLEGNPTLKQLNGTSLKLNDGEME